MTPRQARPCELNPSSSKPRNASSSQMAGASTIVPITCHRGTAGSRSAWPRSRAVSGVFAKNQLSRCCSQTSSGNSPTASRAPTASGFQPGQHQRRPIAGRRRQSPASTRAGRPSSQTCCPAVCLSSDIPRSVAERSDEGAVAPTIPKNRNSISTAKPATACDRVACQPRVRHCCRSQARGSNRSLSRNSTASPLNNSHPHHTASPVYSSELSSTEGR